MTSPLSDVLQNIADGADVSRLSTPETLRTNGDRRRRRTALGLLALVAVASSVVVLVLATVSPSDRSTDPVTPVPSSPGTPQTDDPSLRSSSHPIATGSQRFSAHAIAVLNSRYVVVGDSSDFENPGPAIYWSDDGVEWHAPAIGNGPESVNVTDLIATSGSLLAVGVGRGGKPAAWHSADGQTWVGSPVSSPAASKGALWGITETRLGYFAWGFVGGTAHMWRSDDGSAWEPVADQSVFDLPQTETICAVRDTAGKLQATGVEAPSGTRAGHGVAWASTDGRTWTLTEAAGAQTNWCDPTDELGHWEAQGDAGAVRVDPYGTGNVAELRPSTP